MKLLIILAFLPIATFLLPLHEHYNWGWHIENYRRKANIVLMVMKVLITVQVLSLITLVVLFFI